MKKIYVLMSLFILAISFANASLDVDNYSISTNYIGGDYIQGWINFSIDDEPTDTLFEDSEDNAISLIDFLNLTGYEHTCSTNGCLSDYTESNPQSTKQISLGGEEEKVLGFALNGVIEEITSIEFDVTSNAGESEFNQLKIDILNDGTINAGNNKASTNVGSTKNYGIYEDTDENVLEPQLSATPFCQELTLKEAPGFNLGGWIKKTNDADNNVLMGLYDKTGKELAECKIFSQVITETGVERSCSVNVLIPETDKYYVCMSKELGSAEYVTKGYISKLGYRNGGFNGIPSSTSEKVGSYLLFAQPRKFDPVGTVTIENILPNKDEFSYLAQEYIEDKYGSLDCRQTTCYVPIKLISTTPQAITIDNIKVKYRSNLGGLETSNMYDLEESPSIVSGDYQKVIIDDIFKLGTKALAKIYKLEFDDEKIFSEEIEVKTATFDLTPKKTVANYPTDFTAKATLDDKILKYEWDFGDNSSETTYTEVASHSYTKEGTYEVSVKFVLANSREFTKKFSVEITSSKELIETEVASMIESVNQIKKEMNSLSDFEKAKLREYFDIVDIEKRVNDLNEKLPRATEPEDYNLLVAEILSLEVPSKVTKTQAKKVPFFPSKDLIFVDSLKEITGESQISHGDNEVRDAIIFWEKRNLNLLVSTSDLKIKTGGVETLVLRTFELTISPVGSEKTYYVVFDPYTLEYWNSEELKESGDVSYLKMLGEKATLKFSTTSELEFSELPITIAPKISELALIEEIAPEEEVDRTWMIVVAFIVLILFGIFIYVMLHNWYKTKYEKHLFKDKTNLYNVMIYVNNSKKQGVSNSEIRKNLHRSGWSGEQISYIMKRFEGKEVGMPGLSSKNSSNQKEKNPQNNQIDKRQPSQNPVKFNTQFKQQGMFKNRRYKL